MPGEHRTNMVKDMMQHEHQPSFALKASSIAIDRIRGAKC